MQILKVYWCTTGRECHIEYILKSSYVKVKKRINGACEKKKLEYFCNYHKIVQDCLQTDMFKVVALMTGRS